MFVTRLLFLSLLFLASCTSNTISNGPLIGAWTGQDKTGNEYQISVFALANCGLKITYTGGAVVDTAVACKDQPPYENGDLYFGVLAPGAWTSFQLIEPPFDALKTDLIVRPEGGSPITVRMRRG